MVSFRNQSEVVSVNPGCACTSLEKLISVKYNRVYGQKYKSKRAESIIYTYYNFTSPLLNLMIKKRAYFNQLHRTVKAAVLLSVSFVVVNLNQFYTRGFPHNER